jgi:hypothetical protein
VIVGVYVEGVVWAGLHARLAPDTDIGVEVDDPVVALEEGSGRTDSNTRRVAAVVAAKNRERATGVRPGAFFDVLDPGSIDAKGNLMLGLAGDRAGVTADADVLVYDEAVLQGVLQTVTVSVLCIEIRTLVTFLGPDQHFSGRLPTLERSMGVGCVGQGEFRPDPHVEFAGCDPIEEVGCPREQFLTGSQVVAHRRPGEEEGPFTRQDQGLDCGWWS